MAHDTSNTTAFIEAQQYSEFIIQNLEDGMLPDGFSRDVSDFGHGTTLNIKTVGSSTLQDVEEGVPLTYNAIDTGTVTLTITDYVGDAWAVSDKLREDGNQIEVLSGMRATEATRAIQENVETKFLIACNAAQTGANLNLVNGRPHRWVGSAASNTRVITVDDFIAMKLSFDKANVAAGGRIAIVDPIVEATLNSLTNLVNVSNNPHFEGIVNEGFARDHQFVKNVYGFDVYTSNRLPTLAATEAIDASSYGLTSETAQVGDVVNTFMSVADDNSRPMMRAWRRMPMVEGWRASEEREDRFQNTARFGFGAQRTDTLGTIVTSPSAY